MRTTCRTPVHAAPGGAHGGRARPATTRAARGELVEPPARQSGVRGITVTISVPDDAPATATDLLAVADLVSEAAAELLPGSSTAMVVHAARDGRAGGS